MAAQRSSRKANWRRRLNMTPCETDAFLGPSEHYSKPMNDDEEQRNCMSESGSDAASEEENSAENEKDEKIDNELVNDSNVTTLGCGKEVLKDGYENSLSAVAPSFLNTQSAENKFRPLDYVNVITELYGDTQVHIEAINKRLSDLVKEGAINDEKAEVAKVVLCGISNDTVGTVPLFDFHVVMTEIFPTIFEPEK